MTCAMRQLAIMLSKWFVAQSVNLSTEEWQGVAQQQVNSLTG